MRTAAVVVTGASRGFGRSLTLDFVRQVPATSIDLYVWARSERDLHETARLARTAWATRNKALGAFQCIEQVVDLSDPRSYTAAVDHVVRDLAAQRYDKVFLVHNAGSLGHLGLVQECVSSPREMAQYWELNVTSVLWLNKRFLDVYGATRDELQLGVAPPPPPVAVATIHAHPTQLVIMNITSLCGVEPFKTHMMYCAGKAAREMHHRVMALEQAPIGKVRVLQYSPGPMDSDMQQTIREAPLVDPELRKQFADMKSQGTLVPLAQSSQRGVELAISEQFETGARVDYYDLTTPSKRAT